MADVKKNNISPDLKKRRALFKKPSILILDEATNALDKNTEIKLVNNLTNKLKNITIIIITHKLDLIKNFDKIIKIENSKIKLIQ